MLWNIEISAKRKVQIYPNKVNENAITMSYVYHFIVLSNNSKTNDKFTNKNIQ